jgi:flavin-dependent dehydrogenase
LSARRRRVLVAGGGVAGAAACLRLAQKGHRPLWVSTGAMPAHIPGEHLAAAARPLLAEVGALHLLDRPCHVQADTVFSAWGSARLAERSGVVHLEGPGMVLDRPRFEADLVALAGDRGARPLTVRAGAIRGVDGRWEVAVGERCETADFVIDATGRGAAVAGRLATRFRADRLAAAVGFYRQRPDCGVEATRATLIEAAPSGWWYAALLPDRRLALNYYTDADMLPSSLARDLAAWRACVDATDHVRRWIDDAGFEIDRPPRIHGATTTWIAPCAGVNWAAVGDAAAAFDPLSSHGMTTALWTAVAGADAALSALDGDPEPGRRYAERVAQGVQDFLQSRWRIYGVEERFARRPFWRRRRRGGPGP